MTPCPTCRADLAETDVYCRSCGADVRFTRRPGRIAHRIPRALEVEQFQDPGDRRAADALAVASPVQAAVRYYLRRVAEPEYRNQLLGSSLKVSATQFPRVHRAARFCETLLRTAPVEVYVSTHAEAAAVAFGSGATDAIVLASSALLLLDDDELIFLLGCQLGHVKADHVLYLTVAKALTTALKGIPGLGAPLSGMAAYALVPWQRQAALTADRAGLICCQDLAVAASAMVKLTFGGGRIQEDVNVSEVLAQGEVLARRGDWGDTWKETPAFTRRVLALREFRASEGWARIFEGAWDPGAPRFPCYFCPGSGGPERADVSLGALRCDECSRELFVEELPCPACHARIPVDEETTLGSLRCDACDRVYLQDTRRPHLRLEDPPELRDLSAYRVLGVHPSSRPAVLRRAFRERMEPLREALHHKGQAHPAQEKIRLYTAYKTLIDPVQRGRHDALLAHAREVLARTPPEERPLPRCSACAAPLAGRYCGLCGKAARPVGEEAAEPPLWARLQEELATLAAEDQGELLTAPREAFDLAFHQTGRSLYLKHLPELLRPGPLRAVLRAAADILATATWSHAPAFTVVVDGPFDGPLVAAVLREADREGRSPPLTFLRPDGADGLRLREVDPSRAEGVEEEAGGESVPEWIERRLGLRRRDAA